MVDAHGGKIAVASAGKDKGATFIVTSEDRRVARAAARTENRKSRRPILTRGRGPNAACRVLVVDDHHDTCIGMKMMLERRGYEITVAHTADQAVEKARSEEFDLLISDIGLPDRSGYELMRELRATKGLRGIAISGFGMENDMTRARAAGFSEHLTKPINFERLEEAIQRILLEVEHRDPTAQPTAANARPLTDRCSGRRRCRFSDASFNSRESFSTRWRMILPALNLTVARGGITKLLPGSIRIAADARLGQAWLKNAEIAQLDRDIVRQTIGDVIQVRCTTSKTSCCTIPV